MSVSTLVYGTRALMYFIAFVILVASSAIGQFLFDDILLGFYAGIAILFILIASSIDAD